jgi:hypothetical protein
LRIEKLPSDDESLELPSLAIAIEWAHPDQRHVGFYFQPVDEPLKIIHMGWHGIFEIIDPASDFAWVEISGIDPIVLDNIADWLPQTLKANNGHMAYSIKPFDADPFDDDGKVIASVPGDGFTCATFLLWVFVHFQLPLIDVTTWRDREQDQLWRQKIFRALNGTKDKYGISDAHIAAQSPYVAHAARFRPEEVAGAAGSYKGQPLSFEDTVALGDEVLEILRSLGLEPHSIM